MQKDPIHYLGIIAGSKSLPLEIASEARRLGVKQIVAAAIEGETDPKIKELADKVAWVKVGQLGKLISFFKEAGVRHCVMAGQVAPKNLFDLRPDLRTMKVLLTLKERNAHSLFGAVAAELKKDGIELVEAIPWLGHLLAGKGFRIGPPLDIDAWNDIQLGYKTAKAVSALEIGQLAVVKQGTILAVEGFEGTDRCLSRGGELAGPKGRAIAVKVAKAGHDLRFDIPTIGKTTAETCCNNGIRALLLEPGKTIVLDQAELKNICKAGDLTISAIPEEITTQDSLPGQG